MGAKHASIHFRTEHPDRILSVLKKEFGKKKDSSKYDLAMLQLLNAFAQKNIETISDENEKVEKKADLVNFLENARANMGEGDNAVIVIRKNFISLYWYDHIRVDNLDELLYQYAHKSNTPVLGVALYDDSNFVIHAVYRNGQAEAKECKGFYWFDEDDIQPAEAADLCHILNADFLLTALEETLSCIAGETMAESFEQKTGLTILMDTQMCNAAGMKEFQKWKRATVFHTGE